jgi:hypothetical protein
MREHLPEGRLDWCVSAGLGLNEAEGRLVAAYVRAHENLDIDSLGALLREDLRFAMPPQPGVWVGRDETIKGLGGRRLRPGRLRRVEVPNHCGQRAAGCGDVPATSGASRYEAFSGRAARRGRPDRRDRNLRQRGVRLVQAAEATPGRLTFRPEGAAAGVYRHIAG